MNKVKINIPITSDLLKAFDNALKDSKWSNRSQSIRTFISDWLHTVKPKNKYASNKDSKEIKPGDAVNSVNCPMSLDINGYKLGFCKKFVHEDYWGIDLCLFRYIDETKSYLLVSRSELKDNDVQKLIEKLSVYHENNDFI